MEIWKTHSLQIFVSVKTLQTLQSCIAKFQRPHFVINFDNIFRPLIAFPTLMYIVEIKRVE